MSLELRSLTQQINPAAQGLEPSLLAPEPSPFEPLQLFNTGQTSQAPQPSAALELYGSPAPSGAQQSADVLQSSSQQQSAPAQAAESVAAEENEVQKLVQVFAAMPGSFDISIGQATTLLSSVGVASDPKIQAFLKGVTTISKSGDVVTFNRSKPTQIALNEPLVDGLINIDALDLGNMSFHVNLKGSDAELTDISGLSLAMSAFGKTGTVPIVGTSVSEDAKGDTVITGQMANPLPWQAQYVLAMNKTIPVSLTLTPEGTIKLPDAASVLTSAADATGDTFPGMVLQNELTNAASIASFADRYPVWMHDTVYPILKQATKTIEDGALTSNSSSSSGSSGSDTKSSSPSSSSVSSTKSLSSTESSDSTQTSSNSPGSSDSSAKPSSSAGSSDSSPSDAISKVTGSSDQSSADSTDNLPPIPSKITHGGRYSENITIDGVERNYLLFVPSSYNPSKPMPLVLALHGLGGNAAEFERQTGFDTEAEKEGFIIAYPNATRWLGKNGYTAWDTNNGIMPPGSQANDIQFLSTIIDDTQKEANIDPNRIYMSGVSNGGMMTYDAISALSNKIAAIAVVSGAMSGRESSPKEPISVLNIHGTDDTVIPINGVTGVPNVLSELGIPTFQPFNYVAKYWTKEDGITGAPETTSNSKQIIQTYVNPSDGAEVEQVTEIGGHHTPSNPGQTMQMVWQFLSDHPKIQPDQANTPPAIKPILGEPVNPVDQILNDLNERGVAGLESDADRVVSILPSLPNGSISPANVLHKVGDILDKDASDPIARFFATTTSMSKEGDRYSINRNNIAQIPLNYKIPGSGGLMSIKNLSVGSVNFNMSSKDNLVQVGNIKGLSAGLDLAGFNLTSQLESISEQKFADGSHEYKLDVSQPLPTWARVLLMEPTTIPIDVKFDSQGKPQVENQDQIESAMIGNNPLVRGAYDEFSDVDHLIDNPNWGYAGDVTKDAGVTTAATVAGGILGSMAGGYVKLGATLGFLMAPVIVDEINKI